MISFNLVDVCSHDVFFVVISLREIKFPFLILKFRNVINDLALISVLIEELLRIKV